MADDQSKGRAENGAIPESEAQGGDTTRASRKGTVAGESAPPDPDIPAANDFEGPAGDPVEGARD